MKKLKKIWYVILCLPVFLNGMRYLSRSAGPAGLQQRRMPMTRHPLLQTSPAQRTRVQQSVNLSQHPYLSRATKAAQAFGSSVSQATRGFGSYMKGHAIRVSLPEAFPLYMPRTQRVSRPHVSPTQSLQRPQIGDGELTKIRLPQLAGWAKWARSKLPTMLSRQKRSVRPTPTQQIPTKISKIIGGETGIAYYPEVYEQYGKAQEDWAQLVKGAEVGDVRYDKLIAKMQKDIEREKAIYGPITMTGAAMTAAPIVSGYMTGGVSSALLATPYLWEKLTPQQIQSLPESKRLTQIGYAGLKSLRGGLLPVAQAATTQAGILYAPSAWRWIRKPKTKSLEEQYRERYGQVYKTKQWQTEQKKQLEAFTKEAPRPATWIQRVNPLSPQSLWSPESYEMKKAEQLKRWEEKGHLIQ